MKVRRVVTGHNPAGKSIVASDTEVDGITFALRKSEFHRLWGADQAPTFPDDGSPQPVPAYFPALGGFRFGLYMLPPYSPPPENVDLEERLREIEQKLPGMLSVLEPNSRGVHTTDTIDFVYILSGEVWLELDDGVEVHLRPGDTVVQNGTRHAWHNKGTESCRMVVCMIGARRS